MLSYVKSTGYDKGMNFKRLYHQVVKVTNLRTHYNNT